MIKAMTPLFIFLLASSIANSQPASITNILVSQRTDGSGYVDIYFNLSGPGSTYNIAIQASFDGGSTYTPIPLAFLSGDMAGIAPGSNKHIVWDGLGSFPNTFSTQARLELTATEETGGGTPCPGMGTFTDPRDGQTYTTVPIGSQCWMKENLNYETANSWCYANNAANCTNYGRLYTWNAALTACPSGWHLPSDAEWFQLTNYMASQGFPNNNVTNGAGNALKSCRQVDSPQGGDCNTSEHPRWNSYSSNHGFDEFGFSALPGGSGAYSAFMDPIGHSGSWWCSTEASSIHAWRRYMDLSSGDVRRDYYLHGYRFSVRCLMDN